MELPFTIKTPDRKEIYGILKKGPKPSKDLIILVPGLGSWGDDRLPYNAAKYFFKRGIDSVRFDFFHWGKGRHLNNCGISTHLKDLSLVIKRFLPLYKRVFLAGHSLGGLIVLGSRLDKVAGILLWDPSCSDRDRKSDFKWVPSLKLYKIDWGMTYLFSKKLIKEWKQFPQPADAAKRIKIPTLLINASKGILIKAGNEYFKNIPVRQKKYICLQGASHTFVEEGIEEKLFGISVKFIKSVK